jgi:hypothetical protein
MLYNAARGFARDLYHGGIYVVFLPGRRGRTGAHPHPAVRGPRDGTTAARRGSVQKIGAKYGILGLDKKGIVDKYGL